jgi:hypothetical protein
MYLTVFKRESALSQILWFLKSIFFGKTPEIFEPAAGKKRFPF